MKRWVFIVGAILVGIVFTIPAMIAGIIDGSMYGPRLIWGVIFDEIKKHAKA